MKTVIAFIIVVALGFGAYYFQHHKRKPSMSVNTPIAATQKVAVDEAHLKETSGCKPGSSDNNIIWFSRAGVEELSKTKTIKITNPPGACHIVGTKKIIYSFFLDKDQVVFFGADENEVVLENIAEVPVSEVNFSEISKDFYPDDKKADPKKTLLDRWRLKPTDKVAVLTLRLTKPFDYDTKMAGKKVGMLSFAKVITAKEFAGLSKSQPVLVDIRPPEQFATKHAPGAINTPYTVSPNTSDIRWPFRGYSAHDKFVTTGLPADKEKPIVVVSEGIKFQTQEVRALYWLFKDGRKNIYYEQDANKN